MFFLSFAPFSRVYFVHTWIYKNEIFIELEKVQLDHILHFREYNEWRYKNKQYSIQMFIKAKNDFYLVAYPSKFRFLIYFSDKFE